jgi:prepilin-type N-terminal cleavage/methylation domain-containing protein/prepilin-type processing-associated H-X9-DG protein
MKQNQQHGGRPERRQAFTLIELFLVVAVIAILAALFLPALSKARRNAQMADCGANLGRIGAGMALFAGEHAETYPESGGDVHWNATDVRTGKPGWMQQMVHYLGTTNTFNCPGNAELPRAFEGPFNYFNGSHAAYMAEGRLAAVKTMAIRYPACFVLSGDTAGTATNSAGLQFDPLDADKNDCTQNCIGGAADPSITEFWQIHAGGQNVLFADGHTRWYRGFSEYEMTFAYTNLAYWMPYGTPPAP